MGTRKLWLGVHPINWIGEDVLEHGDWYTAEQVLDEIQSLGFRGIEVVRKFPKDVTGLQAVLRPRGLRVVSQWKSVYFSWADGSDKESRRRELEAYKRHADRLRQLGSKVISTAELGGSVLDASQPGATVTPLDDDGWARLIEGLHAAGEICQSFGMKLVYHHHAGTVVERMEEIDRLMESTDPNLVYLLYDTGHAYNAGINPLDLFQKYAHRVGYIHLKDVREEVYRAERAKGSPFKERIRRGVFTTPGHGCIDFRPILESIYHSGFTGWLMIEGEQDPALYNPYEFVGHSKRYLEDLIHSIGGEFLYD
ncbi:MAG: myo-inosose-2 dehydratase [Alicyclobacillus shizuokensis]|nr:myo-inosose-2 dehydratase [Alicyclobacillus shizuokensis]